MSLILKLIPDREEYLQTPGGVYKTIFIDSLKNIKNIILSQDEKECNYILYIAAGRANINHIKHIDKDKLIIVDYSDGINIIKKECKYYFKRSCVDKNNLRFYPYRIIPIAYSIKQETSLWFLKDKTSERSIDISVFLSPRRHSRDNRERVSAYIKDNFRNFNIKIGIVGNQGPVGRNSIQEPYYNQMKKSKIIVTCNPTNWEGDWRLFESLSCKCLVFVDNMLTPVINPFITKKHLVYYDPYKLDQLKEEILYYLNNKEELDKIADEGYDYTLKYHKPINRMNEILERINF